ncbi:hypothetical protein ACIP6P_26885 [Streptomyces sp. NPDC088729]|uniref:hypothetical protein n=1 Tax=Streptomyces sp. NPDC088729 TaxID=3365876 RepID=UPI00381F50D8
MAETSLLEGLVAEAGLTSGRFAQRLNRYAEAAGHREQVHIKTPYKWIKKGEVPRPPWPALCAQLLSQELGRLVTPGDLGWPDDGAGAELTALVRGTWDADGALRALHTFTDAEGVHRRRMLQVLGTSITTPAHEWLLAQPAEAVTRSTGTSITIEAVDHLDEITAGLRRLDDHGSGEQLLTLIREHLRYVTTLLDTRRYTDTVGRRLHATAAELLRLGGFTAFDTGQHGLAQQYFLAALRSAHTAGDQALGANILGFMSCQAKDLGLGNGREAVLLAETARAGYPGASGAVRAILALRAAEAYANDPTLSTARRAAETHRAIDDAFNSLDDPTPSHGSPSWSYWMSPSQAHAQAGYSNLRIGDHLRARHHLRRSLQPQEGTYSREEALRDILLASTYQQQPRPDLAQALVHGNRAVDALTGEVDSPRCVGHLARLVSGLSPYRRSRGVAEFIGRTRPVLDSAS